MRHLFDLAHPQDVSARAELPASAISNAQTLRVCTHISKFGMKCNREARDGSLVCDVHTGGKTSLAALRKQAAKLGDIFIERLEEIALTGETVEVLGAMKVWADFVGVKDLPPVTGGNLDEETLETAHRSLEAKLEQLMQRIEKREHVEHREERSA